VPKTSGIIGLNALSHPCSRWFLLALLGFTPALVAIGCGDEDGRKPPAVLPDGGEEDSGGGTGGTGGTGGDAAVEGYVLRGPCLAEEANVHSFTPLELEPQASPSLMANLNQFGLVFAQEVGCSDSITMARMESGDRTPEVLGALDECSAVRNAVGIPVTADEWLLAWLDSRDGGFQVMTGRVNPEIGSPLDPPTRVSLTATNDRKGDLTLTAMEDPAVALLAWTETNTTSGDGVIQLVALRTSDGAAQDGVITIRQEPGEAYRALALAPLPAGGAVLGYVAGKGARRSIYLQTLTETGALDGEPALLSADGDAFASVSLSMRDELTDKGAAVYSVNPAGMRQGIRFQALDAEGRPSGQSRSINQETEHASGVGITPTISGYTIIYRATSDVVWPSARLRSAFLNDVGNRVGSSGVSDLVEVSDFGGAPSVAIALDGRVSIAWFDGEGDERRVKLLSYPCNP